MVACMVVPPGHAGTVKGCAVCRTRDYSGFRLVEVYLWLEGFQRMTFFSTMDTTKNSTTASVAAITTVA